MFDFIPLDSERHSEDPCKHLKMESFAAIVKRLNAVNYCCKALSLSLLDAYGGPGCVSYSECCKMYRVLAS